MKQILLFSLACLPVFGLSALDLRVGPVTSGWNTKAVEAVVEGPTTWFGDDLRPEAGLELGLTTVPQVLVPVGLMWEEFLERGWSWGAAVHGLAGVSWASSTAAFVWGGDSELRLDWSWTPGIGLGLSTGVRYSSGIWEVPVHLVLKFGLDGKDTLEPESAEKNDEKKEE